MERVWIDCFDLNLKSAFRNFKSAILVGAMLFALCLPAEAQQQAKSVPRIGFLSRDLHPADSRASAPGNVEAFRQGLQELGYIEGKNIIIEDRFADGRLERLPALAEELLRLKVEMIIADTSASARGAKKATATIPIVLAQGSDPVQSGLVASFARPGGNVTGLTNYSAELLGKRVELLKEVVPKVSRFALLDAEASGPAVTRFLISGCAGGCPGHRRKASVSGSKSPGPRYRRRLPNHGERAHWRSRHLSKSHHHSYSLPKKDFGAGEADPYASHLPHHGVGRQRWSHVLRGKQR
jgi:hypothetical protein